MKTMRWTLLVLLALALTGCTLGATPPPPSATTAVAPAPIPSSPLPPTVTSVPSPTAQPTATPPPSPTTPSASPTPPAAATPTPIVVHFPIGAISTTLTGDLAAHQRATYRLRILGGQYAVFHLITAAEMHIILYGADGTVLVSPMGETRSWWGVIPSTQDYFLSVEAGPSGGMYQLVITIYPPGETRQTAYDPDTGFALEYPPAFVEEAFPYEEPVQSYLDLGETRLSLRLTDPTFFDHTNLSEAYLTVRVGSPAQCAAPWPDYADLGSGLTSYYHLDFERATIEEGAAGNLYITTLYRLNRPEGCYTLTAFVHATQLGNYDPSQGIVAYDAEALQGMFEDILRAFRLVPQTP